MGQSGTGLRFSITIGFFAESLSKIPILDLKKRGHFFFKNLLYVQSAAILVSQGLTS